jgi:hypothetical protein
VLKDLDGAARFSFMYLFILFKKPALLAAPVLALPSLADGKQGESIAWDDFT